MTRRDITEELDAAQADVSGEGHVLVIRGEEFTLPPRFSKRATLDLARFAKELSSKDQSVQSGAMVALDDAMQTVFGEEQWTRLEAFDLSNDQYMIVVNAVTDLYTPGIPLGKSVGSPGSSVNGSDPQKPTSSVGTESISGEPGSETSPT